MTDKVHDDLRVPSSEFATRRERARALAQERGLDGLVVWSRNATTVDWYGDVLYLTNHHTPFPQLPDNPPAWAGRSHSVLVLPVEDEPVLVVDSVEYRQDLVEVEDVRVGFNVPLLVARVLAEKGLAGARLGLVGRDCLLLSSFEILRAELGERAEFVPADELIAGLRRRKSEAELRLMRHAAEVGIACVDAMMAAIRPGVTEGDVVAEGMSVAARRGAFPYDVAVASGPHASNFQWARLPSWDTERPLERGDMIHIDFYGPVLGYYTDFVRSSVVGGEPTSAQRELLDGAVAFVEHVCGGVSPGISFDALWRRGAGWLEENGFATEEPAVPGQESREGMFPGFGHGIGLGFEPPYIMDGVGDQVEEGMVLAVEILLSREGVGGAGFEQNLIVTSGGGIEVITAPCRSRWWSS